MAYRTFMRLINYHSFLRKYQNVLISSHEIQLINKGMPFVNKSIKSIQDQHQSPLAYSDEFTSTPLRIRCLSFFVTKAN